MEDGRTNFLKSGNRDADIFPQLCAGYKIATADLVNRIIYISVFFLLSLVVHGQYVKGKLTDRKGVPLAYASIYTKNSTYGVASNTKGDYFMQLAPGTYTLVFSFLGYKTEEHTVVMKKGVPVVLNVALEESSTALREFEIVANTKDLAKEIMGKVRDKRRDYLTAFNGYRCETYIKTSLEKILARPSKSDTTPVIEIDSTGKPIEKKLPPRKTRLNLIEALSTTYHKRPNTYKEIIHGYHDYAERKPPLNSASVSVGFEYGDNDLTPRYQTGSNPYLIYEDISSLDLNFYENLMNFDAISPKPILSPIAGSSAISYKFNYITAFYEGNKKIYKLSVEPLFKQEPLFSGYIFIEDSTWALRSVDLQLNTGTMFFCREFRIIQNYEEIDSAVYMPVRRELFYTIKEGKYDINGNTRVKHSDYIINPEFKKRFFGNEVKRYEESALNRDSVYWNSMRPVTLKENELEYISESDSIRAYYNSDEYIRKQDSSFNIINWTCFFTGIGHQNSVAGYSWRISGLINQPNFFGIGGYRHMLPAQFSYRFNNDQKISIRGMVDYGFQNRDIRGKAKVGYTFLPQKLMKLTVGFGNYYNRINKYSSFTQAFSRSNYANVITFNVAQRLEIFNGLIAQVTADFADQRPISDLKLARWTKEVFDTLNTPVDFQRYIKTELKLELEYTPGQKYVMRGNRKIILGADWPVFSFKYRKGIKGLFNSEVDFDYVELGAKQELQLARFGTSRWNVSMGSFVNQRSLRILEWKYFRGTDFWWFSDPLSSFNLLGPTLNTANAYFRASYIHHFEGSILNKIPLLNRLKLQLSGGAATMLMPQDNFNHFEMFAGLERVVRIKKQLFRLGFYGITADNSLDKARFSWKFGLSFYNPLDKTWDY